MSVAVSAVAVPLALVAAASFATANLLQMRAARRADTPSEVSITLFARLVRDRGWLLGLVASVVGYACQAIALYLAPVVVVQPLIAAELLFALPVGAALAGVRMGRREWSGTGLVAGGISLFELVGRPRGGLSDATTMRWAVVSAAVALLAVLAVVLAERRTRRPAVRATGMAVAAGLCFGLMANLTKALGHDFARHGPAALLSGVPYLLAIAALVGLWLAQTAFKIAPLSVSLPVIDAGEPLSACVIAMLVFGESVGVTVASSAAAALAAVAVITGIALLDGSPMVASLQAGIDADSRTGDGSEPVAARSLTAA